MLAAWQDMGRVCCRTQNNGNQFQQGSRKQSLGFGNTATYTAPGLRSIADDKSQDSRTRGMNYRKGGYAASSGTHMKNGDSEWSKQEKKLKGKSAKFLKE